MIRLISAAAAIAVLLCTRAAVSVPAEESWMGAYLNQSKVGYSALFMGSAADLPSRGAELASQNGVDLGEHGLYSEAEMGVRAYGERKQLAWKAAARLRGDGSVETFAFQMDGDGASMRLSGRVEGTLVSAAVHTAGASQEVTLPIPQPGPVFLVETVARKVAAEVRAGRPAPTAVQVLEPHQMTVSTWSIESVREVVLENGFPPIPVLEVALNAGGMRSKSWVDAEGRVVQEQASLAEDAAYLAVRESEEQARDSTFIHPVASGSSLAPEAGEPDLMYSTAVRVDPPIQDAGSIRSLTLELWNFSLPHPIPAAPRQRVLSDPKATVFTSESPLRIRIEPGAGADGSISGPSDRDLAPEPLIQSDHPGILAAAEEATEGKEAAWERASAVLAWMRRNIQTAYRITLPSAVEVLEARRGDCNEQSTLFTAMARAAGVPARICTGLVYQRDGFYYHAWNRVWTGEEWRTVDAVTGQAPVDATHIQLGEGGLAEQTYIAGLIGRLRIRVVEIERHDPDSESDAAVRSGDGG